MEDIEVKPFAHDSNCFEVKSKNEKSDNLVLCGCPFAANAGLAAETWMKEIDKFHFACGGYYDGNVPLTEKDKIELSIGNEEVELSGEQMKAIAKEAANEKKDDEASKREEEEAKKMDDAINQVESITADATANEFYKEQILQKENSLKAKKDLEKLDAQIQKQEEKLKCMEAAVEKERLRQEKLAKSAEHKEEIKEVKKEVENAVANVKTTMHNKLSNMDKETEQLKAKKLQRLVELKYAMTKIMIDQGSRGSRSNCLVEKDDAKIGYCNAKFMANWFENKFCRQPENFCGVCCDKEFSVAFAEDREKCIYECKLKSGQIQSNNDKLSETN